MHPMKIIATLNNSCLQEIELDEFARQNLRLFKKKKGDIISFYAGGFEFSTSKDASQIAVGINDGLLQIRDEDPIIIEEDKIVAIYWKKGSKEV